MASIISRIGLFSDSHFSTDSMAEEEKWFPPICSILDFPALKWLNLTESFLSFWDDVTQENFVCMLEKIQEREYDYLIGLGDYTPGANEEGMISPKTHQQYDKFKRLLDEISCEKTLVWGDHDVGYRFDVSKKVGIKIGTEQGGVSPKSVEFAKKLVGPPYGEIIIGDAKFIYIATNLIRNVTDGSATELRSLRKSQEEFLRGSLEASKSYLNFLLLHDPTALELSSMAIRVLNDFGHKLTGIFHGHFHSTLVSSVMRRASSFYRGLCENYNVMLVPSSWGTFGIGKGFFSLTLFDDGSYQAEKHKF